jgi:hypothetical protein
MGSTVLGFVVMMTVIILLIVMAMVLVVLESMTFGEPHITTTKLRPVDLGTENRE